jgi:hypothetical protein
LDASGLLILTGQLSFSIESALPDGGHLDMCRSLYNYNKEEQYNFPKFMSSSWKVSRYSRVHVSVLPSENKKFRLNRPVCADHYPVEKQIFSPFRQNNLNIFAVVIRFPFHLAQTHSAGAEAFNFAAAFEKESFHLFVHPVLQETDSPPDHERHNLYLTPFHLPLSVRRAEQIRIETHLCLANNLTLRISCLLNSG